MSGVKERIRELLGSGLKNEIVASAVGCDPSYVSQLMGEAGFAAEVAELRLKALTANTTRDRQIDDIEDSVISRLSDAVNSGQIYKPNDLLRAFHVVNGAKRRGVAPDSNGTQSRTQIVQLVLPSVVMNKFVINATGEVVEVDGTTLVTMPSGTLLQQLAEKGDAEKYKQIQRYLPGGIEHTSVEG